MKTFVRAGAGAGKTTNLINQVISQALEFKKTSGKWPKTVLTTFTRKATQELKERLLIHSFKEQPQALEFVQSKSFLNITTIHGLFYTFLTRHGRIVGLSSEFQIIERNQADFWRKQILKDLLTFGKVPDFLGSFGIPRLLESLRDFEKIYWNQSYRPLEFPDFEILYQNHCQKIARELREFKGEASSDLNNERWMEYWKNMEKLIEELSKPSPFGEFSFENHKSLSKISTDQKVKTDNGSTQREWIRKREILMDLKKRLNKPRKSKNNPGLPEKQNETLKKIFKTLGEFLEKNEFDPKHWPEIANQLKQFNKFARTFIDRLINFKKQEAALEPNDLEFLCLDLTKRYPEKTRGFSNDVDIWFIDEFQDTSPLQLEILETLIAGKPYYLVGDPLQSIYFFRGARSKVFTDKQKQVDQSGGEIKSLSKNYRSQAHLVKFFNDFFSDLFGKQNPMAGEKPESFTKTHREIDNDLSRDDKKSKNPTKKREGEIKKKKPEHRGYSIMKACKGETRGVAVEVSEVHSEEELSEVHLISEQITTLLKEGFSPKDLCVLARTHNGVNKVQRELSKLGFPVISHGRGQFFKRREILDAMGLLRFLLNPWDDENLILLLRSPWVGLNDQQLVDIIGDERFSFWSLFEKFFQNQKDLRSGQILCQALKDKKHFGVGLCFRKALIDLGFLDFSFQGDSTGKTEANLWKLINLVEKHSRQPGQSLLNLVNEGFQSVEDMENFGNVSEAHSSMEPDKIHLMTIHASKGLEFQCVFMPFLHEPPNLSKHQDLSTDEERGLWSLRLDLGEFEFKGGILEKLVMDQKREREREEFLRLLYVAMTRAENKLFLSWRKEPKEKSWGFKIKDFVEKKYPFPEEIKWSVVTPGEAVHYNSHKKTGKVRPRFLMD